MAIKKAAAKRDRVADRKAALARISTRVGDIREAVVDGSLGGDIIKLAQAMTMCGLPYSKTDVTRVVRRARTGLNTSIEVTFSALIAGVPLPFGADRRLLVWILDRAIRSETPFVSWRTASEYLNETGLGQSGSAYKQLSARFERLSGLGIGIKRIGEDGGTATYTVFARNNVPKALAARTIEALTQRPLPGMEDRHGLTLNADLYNDIRTYNHALPRLVWLRMTDSRTPMQVSDMALWLMIRCYAAASTTVIPWAAFTEQFGEDSNPRRTRQYAKEAVNVLQNIWPGSVAEVVKDGIEVSPARETLLPDDEVKGRVRLGPGKKRLT